MTEPHAKLAKVRALLDNAESLAAQGSHEAAASYRDKAISLMVVHGIDEAMVAAAEHRREKPEQRRFVITGSYRKDKITLLNAVARGLGCQAVQATGSWVLIVVGFPADLDRADLLWTSLLLQGLNEAAKADGHAVSPLWALMGSAERGRARVSYTKSFLSGFANVVHRRLEEATARARAQYEADHGTSTALVVADRSAQVGAAFREMFPNVRKGARRRVSNDTAYGRGKDAGERADIGGARVGGQRRQLA